MVSCSVNGCMSNHHTICNQKPIQFFTIPSIKKIQTTKRGTEGRIRNEKIVIINKQHEAWLHALKNSQNNKLKYQKNAKVCSKHFHPSVLQRNTSKNSILLKIGACPALNLVTFSQHNSNYNDNKLLPRSIATLDVIERIKN